MVKYCVLIIYGVNFDFCFLVFVEEYVYYIVFYCYCEQEQFKYGFVCIGLVDDLCVGKCFFVV